MATFYSSFNLLINSLIDQILFHFQVCGLIHSIRQQYLTALDSYMRDVDEPVHAFSFINHTLSQLSDTEFTAFHSAVISRIPELVNLSRYEYFSRVSKKKEKKKRRIFSGVMLIFLSNNLNGLF